MGVLSEPSLAGKTGNSKSPPPMMLVFIVLVSHQSEMTQMLLLGAEKLPAWKSMSRVFTPEFF